MLARVLRSYVSIPDTKTRIIDNFHEHYKWMETHKPKLAVLYFKNDWNPECTEKLEKDFIKACVNLPYESFIVNATIGTQGERTKKYYCIRHEPSFLILADGLEIKKVVGSEFSEVLKQLERVKKFRGQIESKLSFVPPQELWESYHREFMFEWEEFTERQSWDTEGSITLNNN